MHFLDPRRRDNEAICGVGKGVAKELALGIGVVGRPIIASSTSIFVVCGVRTCSRWIATSSSGKEAIV